MEEDKISLKSLGIGTDEDIAEERLKEQAWILDYAKEAMIRDGSLMPQIIGMSSPPDPKVIMIALPELGDPGAKVHLYRLASLTLISQRCDHYYVLLEAWVSTIKPGEPRKYARCEDDPNRQEKLMVSYCTYTEKKMFPYKIIRNGDQITLEEEKSNEYSKMEGLATNLLPPEPPKEEDVKMAGIALKLMQNEKPNQEEIDFLNAFIKKHKNQIVSDLESLKEASKKPKYTH